MGMRIPTPEKPSPVGCPMVAAGIVSAAVMLFLSVMRLRKSPQN